MSEEVQIVDDVPYAFEARIPFDHAVSLVKLIRAGDPPIGKAMKLTGAIIGETGALIDSGFSIVQSAEQKAAVEAMTIETALTSIEQVCLAKDVNDPAFDPTPYIPIFLMIAKWLLSRLG